MKKIFTQNSFTSALFANCKKTALAFLAVLFCLFTNIENGLGQTQLIPANDGGFENATSSLAANGWTVVNPTSNNSWVVGTLTKNSGSKSAYISYNSGTSYQYDNTNARTAHFYRDIAIPAGATNITLSFYWKSNGEFSSGQWWDRFLVYTAPTSVTPVKNVPASNSTTITGATLVYSQPSLQQSVYTLASIVLPTSLAGTTVRLIFTWQNDDNSGSQPPTSIDDISLTYAPPSPTISSFNPPSACIGATPTVTIGGTNFTGATAVKFNGVNATSFTVNSATSITAVLPSSGVTTGPITVTTPNGTGTSSSNFTINTAPATVTYSSNPATYCAGQAITVNSPTTTSGGAPTSYSVSPALPAGLIFNTSTGVISGTPSTTSGVATAIYTVTATNSCGFTRVGVSITVNPAAPSSLNYTATSASYCIGTAITNNTPSNSGGAPTNYSISPALPSGLSIDPSTGIISGTPTVVTASNTYTVTASNLCGSTTKQLTIAVTSTPATVTYSSNPAIYCAGQAITVNSPTTTSGGAPTSYSVSPALPAGLIFNTSTGVISGTPSTTSGVAEAIYTVTATNSCGFTTVGVSITVNPAAPSSLNYTTTSASYCIGTAITNNTPSNSGGAPTNYSISPALPSGLSIDPSTGIISGTPTAVSPSTNYTVTASNSCGSVTKTISIIISTVGSWIGITNTDWFTPSNWGCGTVPTATTDVTIPASAPNQPSIGATGAVCHSITNNGTLTIAGANNLDVYGDWTNNGTLTAGTNTSITFRGSSNNTMAGSNATAFYNLIVNKSATANTVTSTTKAFSSTGTITITQGDLILTANDVSYSAVNIIVPSAGILTDNVNWDGTHLLSVTGNIAIDGIFNYTSGTPHVNMNGAGSKTVRSGTNASSGFGFLTLSTGDYLASGQLVINSNFWSMFGTPTGSFSTNGQTVIAKAGVFVHGGTLNINGGSLIVTGGLTDGYPNGYSGIVNLSSGTLNADAVTVGPNTPAVYGIFNQSGGIANIGNLLINNTNTASVYNCTNSPVINITGDWTNNETFNSSTSQVNFNGSVAGNINGTSATTFYNLSIANAAGVTLGNNENVSNTLNLLNGLVTTGTYTLTSTSTSATAVTGYTSSSYVNGKLARAFAAGAGSKVFPIGAGGNYRPLTFAYTASSATSTITAQQFESAITGTVTPTTVNIYNARYWEITKAGAGTVSYTVTLDPTGWTPSGIVYIVKKEGTSTALTATAATTPNYTNSTAFTTFNSSTTSSGTNDFALGADCSSSANAGSALTAICQGGTSAPLGGSVSGTATGGAWSTTAGGTFSPNANTLNATWTPPGGYSGTATLVLTPTGGICNPATTDSKTQVVNAAPVISSQPANQVTCAGTAKSFAVTLSAGTSPSYQWQYSANGTSGWTNVANNTPLNITYTNSTTATLTVTPSSIATAAIYYYHCIVSVGSCSSVTSTAASLTVNVNSTISLTSIAGSDAQTVCQNTTIANITYVIGGGGTGASLTSGSFPPGVTGSYAGGVYTISGTPTTAALGTYNYTITTAGPCTQVSASGSITVLAVPSGSVTVIENSGTANDNIICAGDNVTFIAPAGNNSYTWYVNSIKVQGPNTNNTYSTTTLPNNATVTVNVANGNNCGATFTAPSVTVNPLPSPTLIANPSTPICPGTSITFIAGPTGSGYTYTFKVNGSPVQSGSSNIYTTTSYNGDPVTVDVTNANGCTATSGPVSVVINPVPSGTLSPSTINVCDGTSVTFTATTGFANYDFRVNGISKLSSGANTYTTNALVNGDVVTVVVRNTSGCSATFNAVPVNIYALPSGTIITTENSGTANDYNICAGANVKFTATAGFTHYTFYLRNTATVLQDGTSNIYNSTTLTTGDYITVVVTNGNSCTKTFPASATITVVPSPAGTLSVSPSNTICAGDNVTFSATPGFDNYKFNINGTTVQNGTDNTFSSTTLANNDVVTVDVSNSNDCISTFNTITMVVNPLPTGTLQIAENSGTQNDGIICTGTSVTFAATGGFSNYNFLLNGISVQNSPAATYTTTTLANNDKVTVAVTNSGGCIGLLNEYHITVNPLPSVSPITGNLNVCESGGTILLSDATTGGTWTSEDVTKATIDPVTGLVTGVSSGSVVIDYTYTNSNSCSSTVKATITVHALPTVDPITGNFNICTGYTSQLSDATIGGTWGSTNTSVATVDPSTGLVTGIAPGNATISYTFSDGNGCTTIVTTDIVIADAPTVAPITTTSPSSFNVCIGSTITLKDATPGGVWSSSDNSVATISTSGVVTGISAGTIEIRYTITTTCNQTVYASQNVTVNAPPSATISYAGSPFCTTASPVLVTQTGTTGGTFSAPAGLTIDPSTGTITPATSTAGTYTVTYKIAASGGCGIYTATTQVAITANPTITSFSYNASPYCSTVTSASPSLTASTTSGTYTYTVVSGGPTLTLNSATGVINPSTSLAGTYSITYTIAASSGCSLISKTTSVTITTNPTITSFSYNGTPYCSTVTSASPSLTASTTSGTYTYTVLSGGPTLTINSSTGVINPSTSSAGTYSVTYAIPASSGCSIVSKITSVTITAAPTVNAGTNVSTCSNIGAINITAGSSATNYSSVIWTTSNGTGTFANANSLTTATYTPSLADIAAGSVTLVLTANGPGGCSLTPATSTKALIINAPPAAFIIDPASATICQGTILPLTASSNTSTTQTITFNSTNNNVAITDEGSIGNNITIPAGTVPVGAVVNYISVKFNITHGYDDDLILNLKAPNTKVVNLVNRDGGSGDNFTNTVISSSSIVPVNTGSAPFTGTYSPDLAVGVGGPTPSNVGSLPNTYGIPNGTWTFEAADAVGCHGGFIACLLGGGTYYSGILNNWSITVNYTIPNSPLNVTWSPATDLYTDPGATTPYTGTNISTVYAKPSSSGNKMYTATTTNTANCSTSQNVTLTVNPTPVVTITADYCAVAGKVQLKANSTPAASSYLWSTGESTQTILVDEAGNYTVTAYSTSGNCPGSANIDVANELVINGDFEAGNASFTSDYTYKADINGAQLVPAGQGELYNDNGNNAYSITPSGQNVHIDFWGHDHTTGSGNFMAVNGHGNTLVVWKQTVNVLPSTTYYFSAWAMSMNSAGNNAQLQFSVNGALVGTTAVLTNHGETSGSPDNWVRFYGTWTSGPTTTSAVIYINDLQAATTGNDFGLDDVSFSTLSTFINLESGPGTNAQTVCLNSPIQNIVYSAGSSATSPTVTGLPPGVTSTFNGVLLTISGTPTVAGNYSYTITTSGSCQPSTETGTITVQSQKITLSSGSASTAVCINTPVNIGYTLSGTATGATATGLPPGVSLSTPTGGVVTISGTPTVAGSYPYTITTSGTCDPVAAGGTITVTAQTITLNTGDNDNQTVCINLPIANIRYTVGGTATGASVTGLPVGVTGNYSGGIFTISGTPTDASGSPYTYTVITSGTCTAVNIQGTITVTPSATLTLTSGAGTEEQTVCKGMSITDITYDVNNGTGASAIGLPAGVTGSSSANGFKISGTPTAAPGAYDYTITTSGGCATGSATGTIIVQAQTISLQSGSLNPFVCANSPMMPNIVFSVGGTATGATVSGLPTGLTGNYDPISQKFTISGTPTDATGPYFYTVTTTPVTGACDPVTSTGTINIQPGAVGGILTSQSICNGSSGTLTLTGYTGNIIHWEYFDNSSGTWVQVANTTISLTTPALTAARMYRVVVGNTCGNVYSSTALVGIHNLWTGVTSTDWNNITNWSDNMLPSADRCPTIMIPATAPHSPQLTSDVEVPNINIASGTTLNLNGYALTVDGSFSGTGTLSGSATSGLIITGAAGTAYFATDSAAHLLKTLTVKSHGNLILGNALNIVPGDSLTGSGTVIANGDLYTGGNLTLKSDGNSTARVATSTGNIYDTVTVERYIPEIRAWRFLCTPFSSSNQTIRDAWQEGVNNIDLNYANNQNPHPGYGTHITYNNVAANGFDVNTTSNNSICYWDYSINDWSYSFPPTNTTHITDSSGAFIIFVRGSRSVNLSMGVGSPLSNTILRAKGILNVGPVTKTTTAIVPDHNYVFVANPYPSSINLKDLLNRSNTTGISPNTFYVYDPSTTISNGSGNTVAISYATDPPTIVPPTRNYPENKDVNIESGQAFTLVKEQTGKPVISFQESDKVEPARSSVFGFAVKQTSRRISPRIFINLMRPQGNALALIDGVGAMFAKQFSPLVDYQDANKIDNPSYEDIALIRDGHKLAIEARPVPKQKDTLFLQLYYMSQASYALQITPDYVPDSVNGEGWLIDKYLNTQTQLHPQDTTVYNFTANSDTLSYLHRFIIVFSPGKGKIVAEDSNTPKAESVKLKAEASTVSVYPNPVSKQNVKLRFSNMPAGSYDVNVISTAGVNLARQTVTHEGGNEEYPLSINDNWANGVYTIKVVNKESGEIENISLVISK